MEYSQPAAARPRRRTLSLQVQSVLLGVQPLPGLALGMGGLAAGAILKAEEDVVSGEPIDVASAVAAGATSSHTANVDPSRVHEYLGQALDQAAGSSLSCQADVECASEWGKEANAVVLIVGIDQTSGFYCTGGLGSAVNAGGMLQGVSSAGTLPAKPEQSTCVQGATEQAVAHCSAFLPMAEGRNPKASSRRPPSWQAPSSTPPRTSSILSVPTTAWGPRAAQTRR